MGVETVEKWINVHLLIIYNHADALLIEFGVFLLLAIIFGVFIAPVFSNNKQENEKDE